MKTEKARNRRGPKGRLTAIVLLAVSSLALPPALSAEDPFAQLDNMQQVESTYVSGCFADSYTGWRNLPGIKSLGITEGFSSLSSYICYSDDSVRHAEKFLREYVRRTPRLELVMKKTMGQQDYRVYEKFDDADRLTQIVIWNGSASNYCELVVIDWNEGVDLKSVKKAEQGRNPKTEETGK